MTKADQNAACWRVCLDCLNQQQADDPICGAGRVAAAILILDEDEVEGGWFNPHGIKHFPQRWLKRKPCVDCAYVMELTILLEGDIEKAWEGK